MYVPPKPFVLYPEEVNCPGKIDINDDYMKNLLSWSSKFQRYWKASPYLLEERTLKGESRKMHIERYSDRKRTMFTRDSLSQVLMLDNLPEELTQVTRCEIWNRLSRQWLSFLSKCASAFIMHIRFMLTFELILNLYFSGTSKRSRKKFQWNPEANLGLMISYNPFLFIWLNYGLSTNVIELIRV